MQHDILNNETPEEITTNFKGTIEGAAKVEHGTPEFDQIEDDLGENGDRIIALGIVLGLTYEDAVNEINEDGNFDRYTYRDEEYLVVTDSEADELWDEDLDHYIEECILPEVPQAFRKYFDDEKWKNDARFDGRAHSLNRYDGGEEEATVNGTTYYIYRQN